MHWGEKMYLQKLQAMRKAHPFKPRMPTCFQ
jgi:hypothetical protein